MSNRIYEVRVLIEMDKLHGPPMPEDAIEAVKAAISWLIHPDRQGEESEEIRAVSFRIRDTARDTGNGALK